MIELSGELTHFTNPRANRNNIYSDSQKEIMNIDSAAEALHDITQWPGYEATSLLSFKSLSNDIGVDKVWYKDESERFELKSFKALGGAFAVARQLQNVLQRDFGLKPSINDLLTGQHKEALARIEVTCATDGNHGRSIAWGAKMFGCRCVIYIHRDVSDGRKLAMEELGAYVIRISGNYDDSVRLADSDAKKHNRIIVSDTSYQGYMEVPKDVALGYTVMLSELVEQLEGEVPSHIFIQGGVGGLASAVCGYFWHLWGKQRPRCVVVEPELANCLQQSARAGKPTVVEGELKTLMAGLACGEVSLLAWEILDNGADDFITISEEAIPATMRLLAGGHQSDPQVEAGESAVPGLAAAIIAAQSEEYSAKLGLNNKSTILVIGTEGATDPELYRKLLEPTSVI